MERRHHRAENIDIVSLRIKMPAVINLTQLVTSKIAVGK